MRVIQRGCKVKILHVCLSEGSFTEGLTYQENMLADQNAKDGMDVVVVTSCAHYKDGQIVPTNPEDRILSNGVRLVRMPLDFIFTKSISNKIRKTKLLRPLIKQLAPNVILFHGCHSWELLTVARYKKDNPHVKLYVDSHAAFENSATNWLSKTILHGIIYRYFIHRAKNQIEKLLCTSPLRLDFARQMYKVPHELLEVFMMGGIILDDTERVKIRRDLRKAHGITEDQILLLHAGKLEKIKKTLEFMKVFRGVPDPSFHLILAGSIAEEIKHEFYSNLEADSRIKYLGWITGDELDRLYCAADVYLQPGRHSVNVENAICKGCAIVASPSANQMQTVSPENGWVIQDTPEIREILLEISNNKDALNAKREASLAFAKENLDYTKLARRYIDNCGRYPDKGEKP